MRRMGMLLLVGVLGVALPGRVDAADAPEPTCATQYLLCLNDATQGEGSTTWEELKCLGSYFGCLKDQAIGT